MSNPDDKAHHVIVIPDESAVEYLRMQVFAFEELKTKYDRLEPYCGNDAFTAMQNKQEKDRLESAMERRFEDVVTIAEDALKKTFAGDNRALVIAQIVRDIGGLQPREEIQQDNINPLR
ncbi:MAG: hypothetical protein ACREBU_08545 [Nitrososphaera sp.]